MRDSTEESSYSPLTVRICCKDVTQLIVVTALLKAKQLQKHCLFLNGFLKVRMLAYVVLHCGRNQRKGKNHRPWTGDHCSIICLYKLSNLTCSDDKQVLYYGAIQASKSGESMDGWFLLSARCNAHAASPAMFGEYITFIVASHRCTQ